MVSIRLGTLLLASHSYVRSPSSHHIVKWFKKCDSAEVCVCMHVYIAREGRNLVHACCLVCPPCVVRLGDSPSLVLVYVVN